mmetsp:Transcript_3377/g.9841  ORF Transcript_3377/g.9841 Transcript_3377/m.9841 type:complete len:248 (-) Transcript_3377:324-1067(-)
MEQDEWCCLRDMPTGPFGYEQCRGIVYMTSRPPKGPWSLGPPVLLTMATTVATNLCFIPAIRRCFQRGLAFEGVLGTATAVSSALYHLGDTANRQVLGMNPGQWHRLDNVFAIQALIAVVLTLLDLPPGAARDTVRWGSMAVTIFFQELGPWKLSCTVAPIGLSLMLLAWFLHHHPEHTARFNGNMRNGLLSLVIAFFCFVLGLDESKDPWRLCHGCWHVFMGVALYHFAGGSVDSVAHTKDNGRLT